MPRTCSIFRLQSVRGTRDGDRLAVQTLIGDKLSILTLEVRLRSAQPRGWNRNMALVARRPRIGRHCVGAFRDLFRR